MVDDLPAPGTLTISNGPRTISRGLGNSTRCQRPSIRMVLSPCVLGLAAMTLAVVLWGFGYRLSQYRHHPSLPSRVTLAKLWVKPRSESLAVSPIVKVRSHLASSSQALPVRCIASPGGSAATIFPNAHVPEFETTSYLIPPRSPPTQRFLLS